MATVNVLMDLKNQKYTLCISQKKPTMDPHWFLCESRSGSPSASIQSCLKVQKECLTKLTLKNKICFITFTIFSLKIDQKLIFILFFQEVSHNVDPDQNPCYKLFVKKVNLLERSCHLHQNSVKQHEPIHFFRANYFFANFLWHSESEVFYFLLLSEEQL